MYTCNDKPRHSEGFFIYIYVRQNEVLFRSVALMLAKTITTCLEPHQYGNLMVANPELLSNIFGNFDSCNVAFLLQDIFALYLLSNFQSFNNF